MSILEGVEARMVYLEKRCPNCKQELTPDDFPQEEGPTRLVITATCETCEQRYAINYALDNVEDITE